MCQLQEHIGSKDSEAMFGHAQRTVRLVQGACTSVLVKKRCSLVGQLGEDHLLGDLAAFEGF